MLRKLKKRSSGFTLIELMMVIIILGIVSTMAVGQFDAAVARARYSSVKTNMSNLRFMVETYSAVYGGMTPGTRDELYTDARRNGYWKDFQNPFTGKDDPVADISSVTSVDDLVAGCVVFGSSGSTPVPDFVKTTFIPPSAGDSTYVIYAADRNRALYKERNNIYYISNH